MHNSYFCIFNVNQNVKTFITENWIWKVMVLKLISNWVCSRVMNQVLLLWKFCLCKVSSERESHESHIVSFLKFPVHCCQTERALSLCFKKGSIEWSVWRGNGGIFFQEGGKKTLEIIECRSLSLYLFSVRRHRGLSDRKSVTWNAGRVMSK